MKNKNMKTTFNGEGAAEAAVKIQLSTGRTRYGILLDEPDDYHNHDKHAWRFVSYENIKRFIETANQRLIEYLPGMGIVSIDQHLK